jgi:hypothetical protein
MALLFEQLLNSALPMFGFSTLQIGFTRSGACVGPKLDDHEVLVTRRSNAGTYKEFVRAFADWRASACVKYLQFSYRFVASY